MFHKSKTPVVFNVFLAFFITLTVTLFNLMVNGNMSGLNLFINMIYGFSLNLTLETIIDLPAFGNFFVKAMHLKMDGKAAYCVRIFFIVLLLVILMSFFLMFCEVFPLIGNAFFATWVKALPAIFLVAYITALITLAPSMIAAQKLCCKE